MDAVNSEFEMNQQHDGARRQQLWCHLARNDHPLHGFSWGNRQSLIDEPLKVVSRVAASKQCSGLTAWSVGPRTVSMLPSCHPCHSYHTTTPQAGTNVNAELRRFYTQEYATSRMTLVVIGSEQLEALEGLVCDKFARLPPGTEPDVSLAHCGAPLDPEVRVPS